MSARQGIVRIGTRGWAYRHWQGLLYPPAMAAEDWLGHHTSELDCVEVDEHALPDRETVAGWRDAVPEHYQICLRAPREMTHLRRLARREPLLGALERRVTQLAARAGPVVFDLPPGWRINATRLAAFLERLPRERRHAFAFHHPSWYTDETLALLARHDCALVVHDHPDAAAPLADAAGFVFIRLHGDPAATLGNYRSQSLATLAARALGWSRRGKDVYVVFADDAGGHAVKHARRLRRLLEEATQARKRGAAREGAAL